MPLPTVSDQSIEFMQVDLPENEHQTTEDVFTVTNPVLDIDSYIASYKGHVRLQRLQFIANHCPSYAAYALRMCLAAVKNSYDVNMYKQIVAKLNQIVSQEPSSVGLQVDEDDNWIETSIKKGQMKLDKLDQDLKTYKHNSIKESIRRGHDDLGDHYLDLGQYSNALKCYSRARDYCICAQHIVIMCMNVVNVSIYMQNWAHVQTYVQKAEAIPDLVEPVSGSNTEKHKNSVILAKLKCASGLAELAQKQYKAAARLFLQVSFDNLDYPEVLSVQDVAVYGGICALATFEREDLHKKVLSSSSFKQFLELQPQLRDVLHKFYSSKYGSCLELLNQMKDNLLLDLYLSPHVNNLYMKIRNRALIQYFSPYASADLNKMAASFNTSVNLLEDELTQLILDGQISARIDSRKKILYARDVDHRNVVFERALAAGKEYQQRTKALILRTIVIQNQIQVKSDTTREGDMIG